MKKIYKPTFPALPTRRKPCLLGGSLPVKKALLASWVLLLTTQGAFAQNNTSAPVGVYGPVYAGATTLNNGGLVKVGNGGNWSFGGNIISADKGNNNSPSAIGQGESVLFDGTGTYTGAQTTPGSTGNIIDGYAGGSGSLSGTSFVLPIGTGSTAYPATIPSSANTKLAYFSGNGTTPNTSITGTTVTVNSPYYDVPTGVAQAAANAYQLGTSGLSSGNFNEWLLSTDNGATYSLLSYTNNTNNGKNTDPIAATSAPGRVYFGFSPFVLPIQLGSFTATQNGNGTANLYWTTLMEVNSAYYAVESSSNGSSFTEVARVASKNNKGGASYTTTAPLLGSVTYFRLRMVDLDGTYKYSNVVQLTGPAQGIRIAPNPVDAYTTVSGLQGSNSITILSMGGVVVRQLNSSAPTQRIDGLQSLPSGVYIIRVTPTDRSQKASSYQFIKK